MAENGEGSRVIGVHDDDQADILTFTCTETPEPAVAEEAAEAVGVRYDPKSRWVITVDGLNVSARVRAAFGPALTSTERIDPQRLETLHGLPVPAGKRLPRPAPCGVACAGIFVLIGFVVWDRRIVAQCPGRRASPQRVDDGPHDHREGAMMIQSSMKRVENTPEVARTSSSGFRSRASPSRWCTQGVAC